MPIETKHLVRHKFSDSYFYCIMARQVKLKNSEAKIALTDIEKKNNKAFSIIQNRLPLDEGVMVIIMLRTTNHHPKLRLG